MHHEHSSICCLPAWCYGPYRFLVADWQWFKLLCADNRPTPEQFYTTVDSITNLDEHANGIFRAAAIALVAHMKRPDLAYALAQKSLQSTVNADDWRIYHLCAYLCNGFLEKHEDAIGYLDAIAQLPQTFYTTLKSGRSKPPAYCAQWATRIKNERMIGS